MTHALISIPLLALIGAIFAALVGPLGWPGAAIVIVAHWYGRERADAERHHGVDPYQWRDPEWWRLFWPGRWYADAREDFVAPALTVSLLALAAWAVHAAAG